METTATITTSAPTTTISTPLEQIEEVPPTQSIPFIEEEIATHAPKLVVPKFKLRVPKEFQKSVDAAISSSEDSENEVQSDTSSTSSTTSTTDAEQEAEKPNENVEETATTTSAIQIENKPEIDQELNVEENLTLEQQQLPHSDDIATTTTAAQYNGLNTQWTPTPTPPASPFKEQQDNTENQQNNAEEEEKMDIDVEGGAVEQQQQQTTNLNILNTTTSINNENLLGGLQENINNNGDISNNDVEIYNNKIGDNNNNDNNNNNQQHTQDDDEEDYSAPPALELELNENLDTYEPVTFLRICLEKSVTVCLYCNHARRIVVNGQKLAEHMIEQHRFKATIKHISKTEDTQTEQEKVELLPKNINEHLRTYLEDLNEHYLNANSYHSYKGELQEPKLAQTINTTNESFYECFQCRFVAGTHKELYLHNRKMHLRSAILCFMCRTHFSNFSEILCHICVGTSRVDINDMKFRCCLCDVHELPSAFRLMVHLRKKHLSCDVCLEYCFDQTKLSSHVWKHKLRHLCYRCGIAYRNKMDITRHLFWKHGTESIICKRCLQKRWRYVYHFCLPAATFTCDICHMCFSQAKYLKVHNRIHADVYPYACTAENCEEKFISKRLLNKHEMLTHEIKENMPNNEEENVNKIEDEKVAENLIEDQTNNNHDITKVEEDMKEDENKEKPAPEHENNVEKEVVENPNEMENEKKQEDGKEQEETKEKELDEELNKSCKKHKRKKHALNIFDLKAPNLSESSDSSSSSDDDDDDDDNEDTLSHKSQNQLSTTEKIMENDEIKENSNEIQEKNIKNELNNIINDNNDNEDIDDHNINDNAMKIWHTLLDKQDDMDEKLNYEYEDDEKLDLYKPKKIHVCYSDHDYCTLTEAIKPYKKLIQQETQQLIEQQQNNINNKLNNDLTSNASNSDKDSSCSCGSNCSCSSTSSDDEDESSSSSDSDSDTSLDDNKSKSPIKQYANNKNDNLSPIIDMEQTTPTKTTNDVENEVEQAEITPQEPQLLESDLETIESDTDEDFYDPNPQKEANMHLLQQRAHLLTASQSNEDILENGGMQLLKQKKIKKKKHERKLSINNKLNNFNITPTTTIINNLNNTNHNNHHHDINMEYQQQQLPFIPNNIIEGFMNGPTANINGGGGGSSCSEADNPLKRSKRMRRPNKFYGYTSDDEQVAGQTLIIGMHTIKPQKPPQYVWHKDDLPTPSKSYLNNKHKSSPSSTVNRKRRLNKTNRSQKNLFGTTIPATNQDNKPPIPILKIKSTEYNLPLNDDNDYNNDGIATNIVQTDDTQNYSTSSSSSDNEDVNIMDTSFNSSQNSSSTSSSLPNVDNITPPTTTAPPTMPILPILPPPAPVPQTKAFNHTIPPALLPNPDFNTLQYFKANNIRYPIRPPAGARQARDGESVYCYCRCPYDEVSEMIACDGDNCLIEWFHFECVGILMAPQGKWYCAECRPKYMESIYLKTAN